jgi:transcriptional regulator of acetoin/glycerol metabolism
MKGKPGSRFEAEKRDFLRRFWEVMLAETNGNASEAARRGGVHRATMYTQMRQAGMVRSGRRQGNWGDLSDEEPS